MNRNRNRQSSERWFFYLFYWNKEKAIALLQYARDTMPKITALMPQVRTASAAAANISDGYIHSVYDDGSSVKPKMKHVTESVQFKR